MLWADLKTSSGRESWSSNPLQSLRWFHKPVHTNQRLQQPAWVHLSLAASAKNRDDKMVMERSESIG